MISNENLINAFINSQCAQNGSMRTNGDKLFSYATCIAQKTSDGILFNVCKYSTTTSKQQTYTRRALEKGRHKFIEVGEDCHICRGTTDLTRYVKKEAA
jgi:hypothetical protein